MHNGAQPSPNSRRIKNNGKNKPTEWDRERAGILPKKIHTKRKLCEKVSTDTQNSYVLHLLNELCGQNALSDNFVYIFFSVALNLACSIPWSLLSFVWLKLNISVRMIQWHLAINNFHFSLQMRVHWPEVAVSFSATLSKSRMSHIIFVANQ